LDRDSVEDINDYLLPDEEGMSNVSLRSNEEKRTPDTKLARAPPFHPWKFAGLIHEFRDAVFPEGYGLPKPKAAKRKREPGDTGKTKRPAKKPLLDDSEVKDLHAQGKISKMVRTISSSPVFI